MKSQNLVGHFTSPFHDAYRPGNLRHNVLICCMLLHPVKSNNYLCQGHNKGNTEERIEVKFLRRILNIKPD